MRAINELLYPHRKNVSALEALNNTASAVPQAKKATTLTTPTTVTTVTTVATQGYKPFRTLEELSLRTDDLDEEVNYLIDNFIVEKSLNMIFAKAGQGKSYLALCLCKHLLDNSKVKFVAYLDFDNSTASLKLRKLDSMLITYEGKLLYVTKKKVDNQVELLNDLVAGLHGIDLSGYLIVIDSIRDFLGGKDMNSDKDIIPLMDKLKRLRDMGATVLILHHTTKNADSPTAKGSTSFTDSVDCAYCLAKSETDEDDTISITLSVAKDRLPVKNQALIIDTLTNNLTITDYAVASMTSLEKDFIDKVKSALASHGEPMSQNALLGMVGYRKDDKTAIKRLNKFSHTFWSVDNTTQQKLYSVLPQL